MDILVDRLKLKNLIVLVMLLSMFNRCRYSVQFSLKAAWLLGAFSADVPKPSWKTSQGVKLKNMILSEELRYVTDFNDSNLTWNILVICSLMWLFINYMFCFCDFVLICWIVHLIICDHPSLVIFTVVLFSC